MKGWLKKLRAAPLINVPLTHAVRAGTDALGMDREFVIKHLPHVGITKMVLPGSRRALLWSRGDDWVSNQVFWRGWDGYEPEVTPIFWRYAQSATVSLDVGAHVGFYSILAAMANPDALVYAFEPVPAVFERLERNLRLNGLQTTVAVQRAVGATDGEADFFCVPGIPCSASLSEDFMRGTSGLQSIRVKVVRIETFAQERGLERIDLMKLDTETTEPAVIAGMGQMLRKSRPNIFCEVLPRADTDTLTALLEPFGYAFYLLTGDGPRRCEKVVADTRWFNYLFTPHRLA